jgi:hypothetical protein
MTAVQNEPALRFLPSKLPASSSLFGASISIAPAVATMGYPHILISSRQREGLSRLKFTGNCLGYLGAPCF